MTEINICVECKHYRLAGEQPAGSQHRCNLPQIDLVTGKETKRDVICEQERSPPQTDHRCGPTGKFWESRV
jgi:hypothetical protein